MTYRHLILVLCMTFLAVPAQAQARSQCYSQIEAEAEQGLRIHSELMVIGLNCQHMGTRKGYDLYGDYRRFTARHGDLFATYEKILLRFFRQNGGGNPEEALNTLRTRFANRISNAAASMRPDVFCANHAPRILKAIDMDRLQLRKWAATIHDTHPVSYPVCR